MDESVRLQNEIDWQKYNRWNKRHESMSKLWTEKFANWLRLRPDLAGASVLDFGCGYFDLGSQLVDICSSVDGFDPSVETIETARKHNGTHILLTSSKSDLPRGKYDFLLLNSVVQYMKTLTEFREFLRECRLLLAPGGRKQVILADIIPNDYSPYGDAVRCLLFAGMRGYLFPMLRHLIRAATVMNGGSLLRLDASILTESCNKEGFDVQFLSENLTPSVSRYSCILTMRLNT